MVMKNLVTLAVAFGLLLGAAAPVFAGATPKTKTDCEKAHMKWDSAAQKCGK
jgi:hypothetical protein